MLGTHLDPQKQKFETWAANILSHNVSLCNTKSHMNDDGLRRQMEIILDEELRTLASEAKVLEITNLRDWMNKVKEIDNCQQIDLKRMAHFFDATSLQAAKRQNTGTYANTRSANTNFHNNNNTQNPAPSSSSNPTLYPPRLTDKE